MEYICNGSEGCYFIFDTETNICRYSDNEFERFKLVGNVSPDYLNVYGLKNFLKYKMVGVDICIPIMKWSILWKIDNVKCNVFFECGLIPNNGSNRYPFLYLKFMDGNSGVAQLDVKTNKIGFYLYNKNFFCVRIPIEYMQTITSDVSELKKLLRVMKIMYRYTGIDNGIHIQKFSIFHNRCEVEYELLRKL